MVLFVSGVREYGHLEIRHRLISAGTYLFVQRQLHLIEYQQCRGYTAPLDCEALLLDMFLTYQALLLPLVLLLQLPSHAPRSPATYLGLGRDGPQIRTMGMDSNGEEMNPQTQTRTYPTLMLNTVRFQASFTIHVVQVPCVDVDVS